MTPTYALLLLIAELTGEWTPRDAGIVKQLLERGYTHEDIRDALRGVGAIVVGTLPAPEGALRWVQNWDARLLLARDFTSGRLVVELARDVWRRGHDATTAGNHPRGRMDVSSLERASRAPVRLTI